jgi:hypothetical protein
VNVAYIKFGQIAEDYIADSYNYLLDYNGELKNITSHDEF